MNEQMETPERQMLVYDTEEPRDVALVGGKGRSLLELTRAGFPVPAFFIVTTSAWRMVMAANRNGLSDVATKSPTSSMKLPGWLRDQIATAYQRLGGGRVAVRSSAVAEDSAEASFAGQQETILGVLGLDALLDALVRCWASGQSERSRTYRTAKAGTATLSAENDVALNDFPMAIVVQRLVPAQMAGVLFTRDPTDATGEHLLIEAAWGLGEGVVSGKVMPDRYKVRRSDGTVVGQQIADKHIRVGELGEESLPEEQRYQACLTAEQLKELAQLALRVEAYYGQERDIEWAFAEGRFWLLQARPITTITAWEREAYRQEEIARLQKLASPGGTVWARYNLAESLHVPTPLTWAVLQHFMSGRGGYGLLLRDLGFDPDPILDEFGFLDLVAGRPYVNLSREPLCYFRHYPLCYPFEALKAEPKRALYPTARLDRSRFGWRFWLHLPRTFWKMLRQAVQLNRLAAELPDWLRQEVYPAFRQEAEAARHESLMGLSDLAVWKRLEYWQERTLTSFARQALRPTVVLGHLLGTLEHMLRKAISQDEAAQAVRQLLVGVRPDAEADVAGGLQKLARGEWSLPTFLSQFGHRGEQEMELAQPRWQEAPHTLPTPDIFPASEAATSSTTSREKLDDFEVIWEQWLRRYQWPKEQAQTLRPLIERARACAALRETSRHYLLMGYSVLRQCLVELGRRWQLGDDIFYLTPTEIAAILGLAPTTELTKTIGQQSGVQDRWSELRKQLRQRRRQRQIAQTLEVPTVLFSDELEVLGQPQLLSNVDSLRGIAVSPGVGEGPALVLREPRGLPSETPRGYVLVCPSTDPAWMPLFLHARALVMETGGVLSHGAIVAREFGLPAVVGITDACQRFRTGQRLRVNGNTGEVQLLTEQ